SGELIATTKVGAEGGFWLLWLILIGCIIKVFAQVEFGRHTITHSETPLEALNSVPGPRGKRVNWLIAYWAFMTLLVITQQGGIVGGVGQALSISAPITAEGRAHRDAQTAAIEKKVEAAVGKLRAERGEAAGGDDSATGMDPPGEEAARAPPTGKKSPDPAIWATIMALLTSVLLWFGRYGVIQLFATIFVAAFTFVTILTVIMLQGTDFAIRGGEVAEGLSFRLPPEVEGSDRRPLGTALAAFGIIGVGAAELIMYPYWCLEKGYARHVGRRDGSEGWFARAKGWIRVLQVDAWASMAVYTFATVAFLLLGAAVLHRTGLNPEKGDMVATLAQMYVPVFGDWAPQVFLFGAFAVLYSTFFVAAAGNARMVADGLGLFGWHDRSEATRAKWTRVIAAAWPILALSTFLFFRAPAAMVLLSGVSQAVMLPMLGVAALYFRYRRSEKRLRPGRLWDVFLWISCAGFLVAGGYAIWEKLTGFFG
ncbi:MAG: transmembrane Mn(2+) transporter, partial [Akkermansiaceae bacterium]|nr:transmembrane Mn(2+) transporter [Akkermansiaceae bacterium]